MWFASSFRDDECTLYGFVLQHPVGAFQSGALNAMTSADSWLSFNDSQNHPILRPSWLLGQGCDRWLDEWLQHHLSVTGTWDRLACMPVDRGKSWEPAHTSWILSYLVLSRLDLISSSVFTVVSLIKGCCPLCTSSASHLISCLAIVVCSRTFSSLPLLVPAALPCDPNVLERSRKHSYYK